MKYFDSYCLLAVLASLSILHNLWGQEVWVEDAVTGEALENVTLFSQLLPTCLSQACLGKVIILK